MTQREKLKYEECKHAFALIHPAWFLHFPRSTAHGVQENQRPHLHGGVSKGIPQAFPGPPHHTVVILALVLPCAVELPI